MKIFHISLMLLFLLVPNLQADLMGARSILDRLQQDPADPPASEDTLAGWRSSVEHLQNQAATLDDRQHLGQFQTLLNQWVELRKSAAADPQAALRFSAPGPESDFTLLIKSLPPPSTWDELDLAAAADEPPLKHVLQALDAALNREEPALRQAVDAYFETQREQPAGPYGLSTSRDALIPSAANTLLETYHWTDWYAAWLNDYLDTEKAQPPDPLRGQYKPDFEMPSLARLYKEEEAAAILRNILTSSAFDVTFYTTDSATMALARKVARENLDQLPRPYWALAESLEGSEIYEAFAEAFPDNTSARAAAYEKERAAGYYLLWLVLEGRTEEAAAFIASPAGQAIHSIPYDASRRLLPAGRTGNLVNFLHDHLSNNPNSAFWDDYIQLSIFLGRSAPVADLVERTLQSSKLAPSVRETLENHQVGIFLASGKVDEALQRLLPAEQEKASLADLAQVIQLGDLLDRPSLVEKAESLLREELKRTGAGDRSFSYEWNSVIGSLIGAGRFEPAEEFIQAALQRVLSQSSNQPNSNASELLQSLVRLYYGAGRPEDVLFLADHAPYWEAADAAAISRHQLRSEMPLLLPIAWALSETGRKNEAIQAIEGMLQKYPGLDPAYELYLDLKGAEAMPVLQDLFRLDPFEERPLIWQAVLHLQANELDKAEAAARQAIAVDPSDGEQGPGDRLRAYAVLADVKEAQGQLQEAVQLREAVGAIRLAEEADRYRVAGLTSRAIEMYEESLNRFSDAYCIQSRLAVELAGQGKAEAAAVHYRRAFELMPESFGRVESHCFGCEGIFSGPGASIAEEVFQELLQKMPDRAQLHYLSGYLHMQRNNYAEALEPLQRAVELDAHYLNAWVKLHELSRHITLPVDQRDNAVLQILRLDPLGRHSHVYHPHVADLIGFWHVIELNLQRMPEPAPDNGYPLKAAQEELARQDEAMKELPQFDSYLHHMRTDRESARQSPGERLSQHALIQLFNQMLVSQPR